MSRPAPTPPTFLARAALALGLLRATDARGFLRAARHIRTTADRLGHERLLAALHGEEPDELDEDEVTAARRRAYLHQHHELGS